MDSLEFCSARATYTISSRRAISFIEDMLMAIFWRGRPS